MSTSRIIQKTVKDKSILNAFQSLLGNDGANLSIVFPKLALLLSYIQCLDDVFEKVQGEVFIPTNVKTELKNWSLDYSIKNIMTMAAADTGSATEPAPGYNYAKLFYWYAAYVDACAAQHVAVVDGIDIAAAMEKTLTEANLKEIGVTYAEFKKSTMISTYITICRNLSMYKTQIREAVSVAFVAKLPGIDFAPLVFTRLDFKSIYASHYTQPDVCQTLASVLRDTLLYTYNVYRIISSPDVNVEKFSQTIIDNLGELKKQIPRCELAFKKIEESLGLLKHNFDGYYRTFVITKNPGSLIEGFITDVSTSTKTSPQLSRQFAQIMAHYKKRTNSTTDPQILELLNTMEENLQMHDNSKKVPPPAPRLDAATIAANALAAAEAAAIKAAKRRRKREAQRDRANMVDEPITC